MIFIRTDASEKAATGHMMRCMAIGRKLEAMGEEVCFLLKEAASQKVLDGRMPYQVLEGCESSIYAEIPGIIEFLETEEHPKLLLDSYEFDGEYMRQLKEHAMLITFDDMFQEKFPADIIINYNIYAFKYDYASRYARERAVLLLGSSYVPLRDEFIGVKVLSKKDITAIMLVCGGGDTYHVLWKLLEKFCKNGLQRRYHILVVAGALNTDKKRLKQFAGQWENITVYENVKGLAPLMAQVDLVVSAAGTVLYECCCLKKPTIFFTMADNQEEDVAAFGENGMMHYAGDIRKDMDWVVGNILKDIEIVAQDAQLRKGMIDKMSQVTDGKGAERIAQAIIKEGKKYFG